MFIIISSVSLANALSLSYLIVKGKYDFNCFNLDYQNNFLYLIVHVLACRYTKDELIGNGRND
jgi:hypothetical protein